MPNEQRGDQQLSLQETKSDVLRPRAFLSRRLPVEVERRIAEHYDIVLNREDTLLSPADLIRGARGCRYLFTSAMQSVPREVISELADTLKAIGTLSVGFNHIDVEAAREFGVAIFYSPGVLSDACAEIAVLLLLNAARRGYEADQMVRSGSWKGFGPTQLLGIGLVGRRVGIFGMGRIGQATAQRLRPFGVEVHYHNRHRLEPEQEQGATYHPSVESFLSASDFLILCAPGTPELVGFLNRERIEMLPPNAVVVNVSRGDTIEDDALIEALQSGRVFAAGLDVFANEPEIDPRYRSLPNVFLTPHIGSATTDTRTAMGLLVLEGLLASEQGITPENQLC
jgi:lactate dehydrogenase-like 2-hydroxyacid dehydrogenase